MCSVKLCITVMISYALVSSSAVQIGDLSYIHLYLRHQRVYYELTKRPAHRWFDSSVGRALYRYRRGPGFKVQAVFFQALISQLLKLCVYNDDDQSCLHFFLHRTKTRSFIYSLVTSFIVQ